MINITSLKGQVKGESLEREIHILTKQVDSITDGKLGRSAFLDRGFESTNEHDKYDSLDALLNQKIKEYLRTTISLQNADSILGVTYDIKKTKGKRIYQREYVTGGTQEEYRKLIQIIYVDSITVHETVEPFWTLDIYSLDGKYIEFQSKKGCSTCCRERILFGDEIIYDIEYRDYVIQGFFSYDQDKKEIRIDLNGVYVDSENDEGFEIINEIKTLIYDGTTFRE
jgi:hypothetical protein